MIKIRNSEIDNIIDLCGDDTKLYLYYDYENNEVYLRSTNNGKALCCLNDVIDNVKLDISNIADREIFLMI